MGQNQVDTFICYQKSDETFARKLARAIEAFPFLGNRLKVFFAPWDIQPGMNIVQRIEEALEKARFILIVLSPEALQAEWPSAERAAAIYSDPAGRLGRVIPLLRRPCRIPAFLKFRNYLDFRDDHQFETQLTRLLCVLTGRPLPRDGKSATLDRVMAQPNEIAIKSPFSGSNTSWAPDPVAEEIYCNLFVVKSIPQNMWSVPCSVESKELEDRLALSAVIPPFVVKEKRLFTFVDLHSEDVIFQRALKDLGTVSTDISPIAVEAWLKDEVRSKWLVELLNIAIENYCRRFKLDFDPSGKRYYYRLDTIAKKVKWAPSRRRTTKELVIQYRNKKGEVRYVAHRSLRLRFEIIGGLVFLKVNSGWIFSRDGYRLIEGRLRSSLSTRFLAHQKNQQNLNEVRFWAWFLSKDGKIIRMDLGGPSVEVYARPFSVSIMHGIFGDYKELPRIIRGPPTFFEQDTSKEVA